FAVLHAPQHTLSRIAGNSKIGGLQRRKVRFPNLSACGFTAFPKRPVEPIGDRVADKKKINVALLCDIDKPLVPRVVPLVMKRNIGGSWSSALPRAKRRSAGGGSTRGCLSLSKKQN